MYKIQYLPTGNIFVLPEITAAELKKSAPCDYKILEKNGKKFKDKISPEITPNTGGSILYQVLDADGGDL